MFFAKKNNLTILTRLGTISNKDQVCTSWAGAEYQRRTDRPRSARNGQSAGAGDGPLRRWNWPVEG